MLSSLSRACALIPIKLALIPIKLALIPIKLALIPIKLALIPIKLALIRPLSTEDCADVEPGQTG